MKLGRDTKMPLSRCPGCGKALDCASGIDAHATPKPGDFTICIECGHLMAFDNQRRLRELTDTEMYEVAGDRRVILMQAARAAVMKKGE